MNFINKNIKQIGKYVALGALVVGVVGTFGQGVAMTSIFIIVLAAQAKKAYPTPFGK